MSEHLVSTKHSDFERVEFEHAAAPMIRTTLDGKVHHAWLCGAIALSTHKVHGVEFGCLAMSLPGQPMALYQPLDASGLRSVAVAMTRVADLLDGGKGKQ